MCPEVRDGGKEKGQKAAKRERSDVTAEERASGEETAEGGGSPAIGDERTFRWRGPIERRR